MRVFRSFFDDTKLTQFECCLSISLSLLPSALTISAANKIEEEEKNIQLHLYHRHVPRERE